MSKSKEQRKEAKAHETKQRSKDVRKNSPEAAAKRAYEYMVVGGLALFFQAIILCSTGFFWSGGFLFPLAVLCWVKSRSRAFSTCLAIVGFAVSIFELCDCTYTLILLYTNSQEVTYVSRWVAAIALEILGAILAALGIIVFPMAIVRLSQATSLASNESDTPLPTVRVVEDSPAVPPQQLKPMPPIEYRNVRPEMQAAQLVTNPYAQPQPILIAGPPPPPGQPAVLQPAGYAYVTYPPNAPRNAIPIQPLTGQPILAGQPVMFQQAAPRPYSPPNAPYGNPTFPQPSPLTPPDAYLHPYHPQTNNEYGQPATLPNKNTP